MLTDHVTVCGDDLERMRSGFAEIGLTTVYGGAHANGLTHMALGGFPDGSYLELIAPVPGAGVAKATGMMAGWMPLMCSNAGAGAWAIRVSGIHAKADDLRARGIVVEGPEGGGRKRPDGIQLQWETAVVGSSPAGSVLPFMIEDRTDRVLRVQPTQQPLRVNGVGAIVIAVRDLEASTALFRTAFDCLPPVQEEHEHWGMLAHFADTPIILASGVSPESPLNARIERFGEGPVAFLLSGKANQDAATESWFGSGVSWLPHARIGARIGIVSQ
jgi:hypothetical protein